MMTQAELRLIEEGWDALVERLGAAEAARFVMLLDRRTGGALQHLRVLWATPQKRRMSSKSSSQLSSIEAPSL
ncbi:MAG: hypothetical protein AB4911_13495 [Oscillochloridaceae bacterium umkhey_bin13]